MYTLSSTDSSLAGLYTFNSFDLSLSFSTNNKSLIGSHYFNLTLTVTTTNNISYSSYATYEIIVFYVSFEKQIAAPYFVEPLKPLKITAG